MKVGDYVRTNDVIAKVYDICHQEDYYYKFIIEFKDGLKICDSEFIVKSSPNIIDLIEENDLVKIEYYSPRYKERITRLFEVIYKDKDWIRFKTAHCELNMFHHQWIDNVKTLKPFIKSIVTKQQFERMEYEVGE